jgi:hypothetical protein
VNIQQKVHLRVTGQEMGRQISIHGRDRLSFAARMPITAMEFTKPLTQQVRGKFLHQGYNGHSIKLTVHSLLVPWLRINTVLLSIPQVLHGTAQPCHHVGFEFLSGSYECVIFWDTAPCSPVSLTTCCTIVSCSAVFRL